jgi:hypothetical protein
MDVVNAAIFESSGRVRDTGCRLACSGTRSRGGRNAVLRRRPVVALAAGS